MRTTATSNRVEAAVAAMRTRLAGTDPSKVAAVDATSVIDFGDHFAYQQAQVRAHVEGVLSVGEAQTVYMALGEVGEAANGGWASGTDTATKVVVTKLVGELLERRIAGRC